jgi:hypothetical protein
VNALAAGLPVEDILAARRVMTALRERLERNGDDEEQA